MIKVPKSYIDDVKKALCNHEEQGNILYFLGKNDPYAVTLLENLRLKLKEGDPLRPEVSRLIMDWDSKVSQWSNSLRTNTCGGGGRYA